MYKVMKAHSSQTVLSDQCFGTRKNTIVQLFTLNPIHRNKRISDWDVSSVPSCKDTSSYPLSSAKPPTGS